MKKNRRWNFNPKKISSYSDDERPIYELEKEFASYGEKAFEEPSMILDLRGNSGGYSGPPKMWSKPFWEITLLQRRW